jgi:amino-acid N-acetyltransferase
MGTKTFSIRRATIHDVRAILALIKPNARKQIMLERTADDVIQLLRDYFVVVEHQAKRVVGCVALHIYTDRLSELKALAVHPGYQGLGLGQRLVCRCIKEAKDLGVPKVFTLTYIPEFFKRLKFVLSDREQLPEKIWKDCAQCARKNNCNEICLVYVV